MNQDASSGSRQSPSGTMHSSDSGSQSKPPSKRASRAGTRSVSTLSAAQLERKRANDREAQRAIRQRTKDHIENLERRISELTGTQEAREKLYLATQQRNRELEEENAYLRSRLSGETFTINVNENDAADKAPPQYSVSAPESSPQAHLSAGVNIPRPSSSATSRSVPQPAEAWRRHNQYSPGSAPVSASFMPEGAQHTAGQSAASWRAQDVPSASSYAYQVRQSDRQTNYPSPAHQMTYPGHSQAAQFQQAITAQAPAQSSVAPAFHNTGIGAHPDFQSMPQYAASATPTYHDQQSHAGFVSSAPPVSSATSDFHGAPRSLAPPAYNPNGASAHFMPGQPRTAQPMAYREGAPQHAYGYDA
ncbi:unnamed protein product [Aureobasidium vineae]|uniref:BZIP domain-containing protein n=1 Tax=Aureobasidium vineae TaxID=2773715 RepID=A0A9N8P592_9PEZI|nr:unnamed protein product [Aureobasidium vineae]